MAAINSTKRAYSVKIYSRCIDLLKKGKGCAEIGRIMNIPRTTVRNWKLDYAKPYRIKKKRFTKNELKTKIRVIIDEPYSIPEISRKIGCPYNSGRMTMKKYFPTQYQKIKRKAHKLTRGQKMMTSELAYILGVMFGDGYCSGVCQIKLGVIDKDFRDYFSQVINRWLGIAPKLHEYRRRGRLYYEAHFNSIDVRDFIYEFLRKEKIPEEIIQSKNEMIKCMFIRGFFDSEGSVIMNKLRTVKAANKNLDVLKSIKEMLIRIGFNPERIVGYRNPNGVHAICLYGDNIKLFKEKIGFSIKRKMERLNEI